MQSSPVSPHDSSQPVFVFAYGSLIWRPDFEHQGACLATVQGYERRFWQASHDHRGTRSHPGRVVTLVPVEGGQCEGLAYRLPDNGQDAILAALDKREQDGYERQMLQAVSLEGEESLPVITWLASEGNPSWAGEQALDQLASLINSRHGPSGSNADYLLRLHDALVASEIHDAHVADLARKVRSLAGG